MLGVYQPGASALHRLGAGHKLLALAVFGAGLAALDGPLWACGALAAASAVWSAGGLGSPALIALLRPLVWFLVPIAVFQLWIAGLAPAVRTLAAILALVIVAGAVSATTRPTDMLAVLTRVLAPLRRVGVDPATVALAVTFVVRLVPVIGEIAREANDARRARGGGPAWRIVIPTAIRALRHADAMAEALEARGFGAGRAP
ncbi:MAG: energy-coupling factor transporter transmembrane protein EcfT [Rhodospirillaceae bacterium]|nr:energy-coupling factor transporter transmembrane protein EcfT [Rhodospirillaceae bacterium]